MTHLRQTAFRISEEDTALLDAIKAKKGVLSRSEVIRMAIRVLSEVEGVSASQPAHKSKRRAPKAA